MTAKNGLFIIELTVAETEKEKFRKIFDEKIVNLTVEQKASKIDYIQKIDFSIWITEYHIHENYEKGAAGFCNNNSFTVTFKNGELFKCYEPGYDEFEQLVGFLKRFVISIGLNLIMRKRRTF